MIDGRKVVLTHDWLLGMRGGEKCLEPACLRWPDAKLFTAFHREGSVSPAIEGLRPQASILNRLPQVHRYYRYLLPLFPYTVKWRIPDCDLLLSFSHCLAKNAKPPEGVPHVSYCFTPMRYAWHMRESYFGTRSWKAKLTERFLRRLREWDRRTSENVTHFIAISRTIQQRIRECYNRESVVIYPPVDTDYYTPSAVPREEFYLVVSAFAPYKRFDLAVEACTKLKRKLVVIGTGQDAAKLKQLAGPTVQFLGWQPEEVIREHYRKAKALLFPAEEDFGIVPLEAQACGCPVIAFNRGGTSETVRGYGISSDPTGVFLEEQTTEAVCAAIEQFERVSDTFNPAAARRNAMPYNQARFESELFSYLERVVAGEPVQKRQAA